MKPPSHQHLQLQQWLPQPQAALQQQPQLQCTDVANDLAGVKPPSFDWDSSNLAQTFKAFKRYCEIVLTTPMYANRTNKEVVNYILLWMGPKGVEIFDNWKITEEEKDNPTTVWASFSNYFEPKSNYRLARFQLRDMRQNTNEKIDSFLDQAEWCSQ